MRNTVFIVPPSRLKAIPTLLHRRLLHALKNALEFPGYLTIAETTLKGEMIPEARDGFSAVRRWALGTLNAPSRSRGDVRVVLNARSSEEITEELKSGWEKTEKLSRIRSAVSKTTHLFDLLWDPRAFSTHSRYAWDGITLYLQQEGAIVPWPYY